MKISENDWILFMCDMKNIYFYRNKWITKVYIITTDLLLQEENLYLEVLVKTEEGSKSYKLSPVMIIEK